MEVKIVLEDEYEFEGKMFEPTGEYRVVESNEFYVTHGNSVASFNGGRGVSALKFFILKENKPKRWRAEVGCSYWVMNQYGSLYDVEDRCDALDDLRYNLGNYHQTEELAKEYREKVRALGLGE